MERILIILDNIELIGPLASWKWTWHAIDCQEGCLIWGDFSRIDRDTGKMGRGSTRREYVNRSIDVSAIIKTAWVIVELTVRHEAMESFAYDGKLVFDPHANVVP